MTSAITADTPRIAYVTDLDLTPAGGGAYVVNWHAYHELSACFKTSYDGPIVPRQRLFEKFESKIRRHVLNRPGRFTYFSPATLNDNARRVKTRISTDSDAIVFRSGARWCRVTSEVPYYVYLDAVFQTFFENTFDPRAFFRADIERIYDEEARFLEAASGVFFESQWGMLKARESYSLRGSHYQVVGRGGAIAPPDHDEWNGTSHSLVTVAMNFTQKGGDLVAHAYHSLRRRYPSLTWHIIGGAPDFDWATVEGVTYEGVLDPSKPEENARMRTVLRNAFLLLHPTREDTSPLVITEAAYFGCPSVSVNAFAIPELVLNGVTGILINTPSGVAITNAVAELMDNEQRYRDMRRNARDHALARSRWGSVGARMCDAIAATIER